MKRSMKSTTARLRAFEDKIAEEFKAKNIHCPIHLSHGNERNLIKIFKNIDKNDYVFSTHRNHYHYLLHTDNIARLLVKITVKNDSMHTSDPESHFYSSSIVAGCVAIAAGVAMALKMKKSKQRVWCFVGDGASDEGWFSEAVRYAEGKNIPITYIIEDNNRSVCTTKRQRWGNDAKFCNTHVIYYYYKCKYPHCGCGEWVTF